MPCLTRHQVSLEYLLEEHPPAKVDTKPDALQMLAAGQGVLLGIVAPVGAAVDAVVVVPPAIGPAEKKGLLHSDQALFNGNGSTDAMVTQYALNPRAFYKGFASSMIKMGKINPLTGNQGQIRTNCRKVN
ncbi:hypothetical protein K1719_013167 [Acacia pycnantha]|nr:hypothetical protein K1719_013167 [Acacia pycnantha]